MYQTAIFIFYSLKYGTTVKGIDNAAHVGGFLGGCLLALILSERFDMDHFKRAVANRTFGAVAVLTLVVAGIVGATPKAAIDLRGVFEGEKIVGQAMQRAINQLQVVQQEAEDAKAGKISERELEERSWTVHAPVIRQVAEDLSRVKLYPQHPLEPMRVDFLRFSGLLAEALAMKSVLNKKIGKYEPVDPVRKEQLDAELKTIGERMKANTQALKERTK